MTGFYGGDPIDSTTLDQMGVDALETTPGQVQGATASLAWHGNFVDRISRAMLSGALTPDIGGEGMSAPAPDLPQPPMLDPADATKRYGIPGHLTFAAPVSEAVAQDLYNAKASQMQSEDVVARRGDNVLSGALARGVTGLAVGMLDPINLAAGMVPGLGEARAASLIGMATTGAGRAVARAAIGGIQGAAGMAALQPLAYALDSRDQNDWSMAGALKDIAFGTLLGGGLHTLLGHTSGPLTDRIEQLGPEARSDALQTSVAQHVQDQPVNVAPVLDAAALQSAYSARLTARGDTAGGSYAAYTPSGTRVELRPEVMELGDLIASNRPDGTINPDFPHTAGLQPRDRTSAASQAQITEMASRLEPERLGPSAEVSTGAPIVGPDNVVESGNGRTLALHRVHNDPALSDQATAYRAYLAAQGHDVEGMTAPVLIGRRITPMDPAERTAFVRSANERATLGLSAAEQARLDADRAAKAIDAYRPGPLNEAGNADFVAGFMAQIPAEERGPMLLQDGKLAAPGLTRIRSALLAHAYGDALGPTLERILNGDVESMKGVASALTDLAGAWSQMRVAAARGDIPAGLDITPAIGEAVQWLDRARTSGTPIGALLDQADLIGGPSPAADALLRMMFRDAAMRKPIAGSKLAELLHRYVDQAMEAKPGPGLFGEPETSPADIMRAIGGDNARVQAIADALTDAAGPAAHDDPAQLAASEQATKDAATAATDKIGSGPTAEVPAPEPRPARSTAQIQREDGVGYNEAWRRQQQERTAPAADDPPPSAPAEPAPEATTPDMFGDAPTTAATPAAKLSPELQDAQRLADDAVRAVHAELAAGRLTEADLAPLRAADAELARAQLRAQAADAAASCLITGGMEGAL